MRKYHLRDHHHLSINEANLVQRIRAKYRSIFISSSKSTSRFRSNSPNLYTPSAPYRLAFGPNERHICTQKKFRSHQFHRSQKCIRTIPRFMKMFSAVCSIDRNKKKLIGQLITLLIIYLLTVGLYRARPRPERPSALAVSFASPFHFGIIACADTKQSHNEDKGGLMCRTNKVTKDAKKPRTKADQNILFGTARQQQRPQTKSNIHKTFVIRGSSSFQTTLSLFIEGLLLTHRLRSPALSISIHK